MFGFNQRSALILCDNGRGRAAQASAGQILLEAASTPQQLFAFLSESPVDIVILPWVVTEKEYSIARQLRRRYPGKRLAFFDNFANHPLSRHRLDEMGFTRVPTILTHVLINLFESTMLHLFPDLFPDNLSPTLLEFTEPELPLLESIQRYAGSVNVADQGSLENAVSTLLQSFGYTIDLILPANSGTSIVVAGGKLLSITRYFYMLLVESGNEGGATVEAVSSLLFLRGSICSNLACAAITRSPELGSWKPASERNWHLGPGERDALKRWIEEATDLFTRGLSARYFRVSRPQRDIDSLSDAHDIIDQLIAKGWRKADFPEEGNAGRGVWSLPS